MIEFVHEKGILKQTFSFYAKANDYLSYCLFALKVSDKRESRLPESKITGYLVNMIFSCCFTLGTQVSED